MTDKVNSREGAPMSRRDQLIFFKMLFDDLSQSNPSLCVVAKHLVKECIKRHREGDPDFEHLPYVTRQYLRATVGEIYWKRTERKMEHFKNEYNIHFKKRCRSISLKKHHRLGTTSKCG